MDAWDEAGAWEAEVDQFDGSFADEDEEGGLNLAGTQLNEAVATERSARKTVARVRASHHTKSSRGGYCHQGANKTGSDAGKGKGERQG